MLFRKSNLFLYILGYLDTRQFKYRPAMMPNVSGINAANTVGNAPPLPVFANLMEHLLRRR